MHDCPLAQTTPHAPQRVASVRVASQPFTALPSQSPKPGLHRSAGALLWQTGEALGRAGTTTPHAPQFVSLSSRTQRPPQSPSPCGHPRNSHAPRLVQR
jgi:hypothetical protein